MSERAFLAAMRRLNSDEARPVEDARPSVGIDPPSSPESTPIRHGAWTMFPGKMERSSFLPSL
jgi:hypothetical protein